MIIVSTLRDAIKSAAAWQPFGWEVAVFCYALHRVTQLRITKKGYNQMATYTPPDLWQQWQQGNMTAEQATGHVLQNLLTLAPRLTDLEKRVRLLEQSSPKPKP